MNIIKKSTKIGGRELKLEYGRFAQQADCAVLASYGETTILATVVSAAAREDINYFPLFVEYIERMYAGGKIKGSRWVKREGRPTDDAILKARLVDRSIRPLFPETYRNEVQVVITVLSVDKQNDPDVLAIIAVSAALAASKIPWNGPVGAIRMGYINESIINPTNQELKLSDLNLVVSGLKDKVLMLEGGANQISDEIFINSILKAQKEIDRIIDLIKEFAAEVKPIKQPVPENSSKELTILLEKEFLEDIGKIVSQYCKLNRQELNDSQSELIEKISSRFENEYSKRDIARAVDKISKKIIRKNILEKNQRLDGRKLDEIRKLESAVEILPRTHGSAMFRRGSTQTLTVTTLASPALEQWLESPSGEDTKRYMHHYYMPPYSVGETGRMGWPSRREVGHGALAERALKPVIPSEEEFSYTIRVVSEIVSSNGSTSMAAVCGSTLSLMDAGVPIKAPVAGISIGLVTGENNKYAILSDIAGVEDFNGDMDFKIAGTRDGITAIQLDVKIAGLTEDIIRKTVARAKEIRLTILDHMVKTIKSPRDHLSKYAPKVERVKIPKEKIGSVIGPSGKTIRKIIADFNVEVDVEDDGTVTISGLEKTNVDNTVNLIKGMTREFKVGETFKGEVKRIVPFGAFVELFPGREGLVHISRMTQGFVSDPNKIVSEGDKVEVKIIEIDDMGRLNLTMRLDEKPHQRKPRQQRRRVPFDHARAPFPVNNRPPSYKRR